MTSYWLSFRLHHSDGWEATYQDRLEALNAEIEAASGGGTNWWISTTSFYIFKSAESIDSIVFRVKRAIAETVDLAIIGRNEILGGRAVGNLTDQDIFALFPGITKA